MTTPARPAPLVLLIAGKTKRAGKTTLLTRCFPRAIFIGRKAAIVEVAQSQCGYTPYVYDAANIDDVEKLNALTLSMGASGIAQQYGAIVVDDGTLMLNVSMQRWDASPASFTRGNNHDDFYKYRQLDAALTMLAANLSALGVDAAISTHLTDPGPNKKGIFYPGAPDVPSANQLEHVPAWADVVARLDQDPDYLDPWWPGVMHIDNTDKNWVTGERIGLPRGELPANLREVLMCARSPRIPPRLKGLEYLDDIADATLRRLEAGKAPIVVAQELWAYYLSKGFQPNTPQELHVRWGVQDGIARYVLRQRTAGGLFANLGQTTRRGAPPPPTEPAEKPPADTPK